MKYNCGECILHLSCSVMCEKLISKYLSECEDKCLEKRFCPDCGGNIVVMDISDMMECNQCNHLFYYHDTKWHRAISDEGHVTVTYQPRRTIDHITLNFEYVSTTNEKNKQIKKENTNNGI